MSGTNEYGKKGFQKKEGIGEGLDKLPVPKKKRKTKSVVSKQYGVVDVYATMLHDNWRDPNSDMRRWRSEYRGEETCIRVVEHLAGGGFIAGLPAILGVCASTIDNWRGKYPEFDEAIAFGKSARINMGVNKAWDVAMGIDDDGNRIASPNGAVLMSLLRAQNPKEFPDKTPTVVERKGSDFVRRLKWEIRGDAFYEQQMALDSKAMFTVIFTGRQAGKTETDILALLMELANVHESSEKIFVAYIGLTIAHAKMVMWDRLIEMLGKYGFPISVRASDSEILVGDKAVFYLAGAKDKTSMNRLRGIQTDLIVIDECQSQEDLEYLIKDVASSTTMARGGRFILSGTKPDRMDTYWYKILREAIVAEIGAEKVDEGLSSGNGVPIDRLTYHNGDTMLYRWNFESNTSMGTREEARGKIERLRVANNLSEKDPTYLGEYLGYFNVFDAEVFPIIFKDHNYFEDEEFEKWREGKELRAVVAMDQGRVDNTAVVVIIMSPDSPTLWVVDEWQKKGLDVKERAANGAAKQFLAKQFVGEGKVETVVDKSGMGLDSAITMETTYGFKANASADVQDKYVGLRLITEYVNRGALKVKRNGILHEEARKIMYARDKFGNILEELDERQHHSDIVPALMYGMRFAVYGSLNERKRIEKERIIE